MWFKNNLRIAASIVLSESISFCH